jgi:[acyl-carrier-protein] S-malonyltransferase
VLVKAGLFPGQGIHAQIVLEALTQEDSILEPAQTLLGYPLHKRVAIAARRKNATLPTALSQPAIFVAGVAAFRRAWSEDRRYDFFAGHSLGEYAALVAAEAMTFENALEVVRVRGEAMQSASRMHPGSMAAVMGLQPQEAEEIADLAGVSLANDNGPGQAVLAGSEEGLARAAKLANERGARCVLLEISGPFHTSAVAGAAPALHGALDAAEIVLPKVPVISNVTARPYRSPEEIKDLLVAQLTSRVRWRESLEHLYSQGVRDFEDFGPGRVVAGLAQRVVRSLSREEAVASA